MTPSEEPNGFPDGFREGLDRWGSNLDRWPPTAANAARARLARDPQARRWLAAAKTLDEHLRTFEQDTAPAGLAARIVARAADDRPVGQRVGQRVDKRVRQRPSRPASTQRRLDRFIHWFNTELWRPAGLLRVAALALIPAVGGLLLGLAVTEPIDQALAEEVTGLTFSDLYEELDDAQQ